MGAITGPDKQPQLVEEARMRRLEARIDALDRLLMNHAPPGRGFDGLVGHRGEGAGTETSKKGNTIFVLLPNPRYGGDVGAGSLIRAFTKPLSTGAHLEYMWSEGASALTHVTRGLSSNGARHSLTEFVNEEASTTHTATPSEDPAYALTNGSMGSTNGDHLVCVYSTSAPALVIESLTLANFDAGTVTWSAVTVTGSNAPPALSGGLYWCGIGEDSDKMVVLHDDKLYWGDITNATAVDFSTTPTTIGFSLPTTGASNFQEVGFGCDGEEVLIMDLTNSSNRVWDVERYLYEGSSPVQTVSDMLLPSGDSGGIWPVNLFTFEGQWCAHLKPWIDNSTHAIVSLEKVSHN